MGRSARVRKDAKRFRQRVKQLRARKPRDHAAEAAARSDYALRTKRLLRVHRPAATIPAWWVNTVVGIFLLPVASIWTQTFFTCFSRAAIRHGFWASEEFWFFSLGAILWTIAFFGLPRPMLVYVFGHELTHALWVWAMGGRVSKFHFHSDGGYIVTNKSNVWIALAPYFFPLYSILVILLYGAVGLFCDVSHYRAVLFTLIGITWAFHVSFTLWMIPKGQTDLSYHGTFFSLVIIYMMNLLVLTVMLLIASPHTSVHFFAMEMVRNAGAFSRWFTHAVRLMARKV